MKTTYLFDFDGVLADSLAYYLKGLNLALQKANVEASIDARTLANKRHLSFEAVLCDAVPDAKRHGLCLIYLAQYLRDEPPSFAPFDGVADLLRRAAAQGDVFIISLSETDIIRRFLVEHDLTKSVSAVFGGDLRGDKVSKISTLVERRELDPQSVLVIGDAASDIDAAKACGVKSVAALWGWQPKLARLAEPDLCVRSPDELCAQLLAVEPEAAFA